VISQAFWIFQKVSTANTETVAHQTFEKEATKGSHMGETDMDIDNS
jgi:hypothetical protein